MITVEKGMTVLAVGAHPDDIELGAGGFLYRLRKESEATIHLAVLTYGLEHWKRDHRYEQDVRAREARHAAAYLLALSENEKEGVDKHLHFGAFKDCSLFNEGHNAIKFIESLIDTYSPDLVLTHSYGDLHDDHRQTYQATLSAARNFRGTILVYQSPSCVPNEYSPTFFVELSQEKMDFKKQLLGIHSSQRDKSSLSDRRTTRMAQAWAEFLRLGDDSNLEAFAFYKSFWMKPPVRRTGRPL